MGLCKYQDSCHLLCDCKPFFFLSFFPLGARVFLTIALDLVISGIQEPVRFLIEAKARVCVSNSKGDILSQDISDTIWSSFKKLLPFTEEFDMILKEVKKFNFNKSITNICLGAIEKFISNTTR
jgi:hypothetical protein